MKKAERGETEPRKWKKNSRILYYGEMYKRFPKTKTPSEFMSILDATAESSIVLYT